MAQDQSDTFTSTTAPLENEANQLLGNYLQRERIKKQFTLEDVASETCIHIGTIKAIESNNRAKMPAPVFARGFIKIYAEFLGLDSQEILERYNREMDQFEDNINDNPDVFYNEKLAESSSFISLRTCVLLFLAALLGLGYYFFLYSAPSQDLQQDMTLETKQPYLHEESKKNTEETLKKESHIVSVEPKSVVSENENPSESIISDTAISADEIPVASADTESTATAEEVAQQKPNTEPEPIAVVSASVQENEEHSTAPSQADATTTSDVVAESVPLIETKKLNLKILFTERTWMQVALDGAVPQQYLFDPAEESSWQADDKIELHIGNSGGVRLFLDDKELPVGGMSGSPLLLTIPDDLLNN